MDFPASQHTVRVRLINTTAVMTIKAELFIRPVQKGQESLNVTSAAFLIEHEASNRKIMFDLGVRKDYWNLSPAVQKRLGTVITSLKVDTDTPTILQDNGIGLDSICGFTSLGVDTLCRRFHACNFGRVGNGASRFLTLVFDI